MVRQWGAACRKRLMENITLQYILKEIMENPRENDLPDDVSSWKQLPVECEKTLADLLAVIAATHDDNKRVMAVCVVESRDHNSITIRLAANTGDLSCVKDGFEKMAKILEKAHSRENSKEVAYLALLQCIVRMDQLKIMAHLRSKHASRTRKVRSRRSPLVQLPEVLSHSSAQTSQFVTQADVEILRSMAHNLEWMFTRFEEEAIPMPAEIQHLEILREIVQAAEAFSSSSSEKLVAALAASPTLDPSTKKYLPEAIDKLARYSIASRSLVGIVRKRHTRYSKTSE